MEQQTTWVQASWDQGACDEKALIELRTRADAYRAIAEAPYERLCEVLGEEPIAE
jgi:hypothetical protein